ncbi:MAG TPA: hypothetical protein VMV94_17705 [Phycisphaerae bacterium]|nr:hypothetical protein [Phycisphaerae bacterium]
MGSQLRLSRYEPEPEDPAIRERIQSRAMNRKVFREMIKAEIADGRLGRRERKELIQFAGSLGIDTYEAYLLLRAVEYECRIALPEGNAATLSAVDVRRILESDEPSAATVIISLLTVLLIGAMVIRVIMALAS